MKQLTLVLAVIGIIMVACNKPSKEYVVEVDKQRDTVIVDKDSVKVDSVKVDSVTNK